MYSLTWSLNAWEGINYRKSLSADTAFPASLLDSLAGFQYLVEELGFQPRVRILNSQARASARDPLMAARNFQNMMLCGDSAGANTCMALARYIGDLADAAELERGWDQVGSMCLHSVCLLC
jgi:acetyl esterase/lipase